MQDYLQHYSERGVAEKSDIAVASRSETEHSKTLSMTKALAPGAATVAAPVDTESTTDVTTEKHSQEQSREDIREITERASSLAIRDQKVSFTVTTVSGTEDFTAQVFENRTDNKVMLIDYFRRMRKWHNRLYRTGIRLTYDVVLPDPGRRLRDRWREIAQIDAELAKPFSLEISPPSRQSNFGGLMQSPGVGSAVVPIQTLTPYQQDVAYFQRLAHTYQVTVAQPPELSRVIEAVHQLAAAGAPDTQVFLVPLSVPDTHQVERLWIGGRLDPGVGDSLRGEFRNQRMDFNIATGIFQSQELTLPPTAARQSGGRVHLERQAGRAAAGVGGHPAEGDRLAAVARDRLGGRAAGRVRALQRAPRHAPAAPRRRPARARGAGRPVASPDGTRADHAPRSNGGFRVRAGSEGL